MPVGELHSDVMPVLLGGGLRLFESTGSRAMHLLKVVELPGGGVHLPFQLAE